MRGTEAPPEWLVTQTATVHCLTTGARPSTPRHRRGWDGQLGFAVVDVLAAGLAEEQDDDLSDVDCEVEGELPNWTGRWRTDAVNSPVVRLDKRTANAPSSFRSLVSTRLLSLWTCPLLRGVCSTALASRSPPLALKTGTARPEIY